MSDKELEEAAKLKPCPFCGANAILHLNSEGNFWFVECSRCQASSPIVYNNKDDGKEHAKYLWNQRWQASQNTQREEEDFYCCQCGRKQDIKKNIVCVCGGKKFFTKDKTGNFYFTQVFDAHPKIIEWLDEEAQPQNTQKEVSWLKARVQLSRIIGLSSGVIRGWEQMGSDEINVEGVVEVLVEIKSMCEKLLADEQPQEGETK